MPRREDRRTSMFTRIVASLAAALVLVLAILAASPELHESLHGLAPVAAGTAHHGGTPSGAGRPIDDEDGCAVTLFAQGLVLALAILAPAFAGRAQRLPGFALRAWIGPAAPRYLRLPSQAPPAVSA